MIDSRNLTRKGFSLIEIIIVVALLAIIIAIGVPSMKGEKSRTESKAIAMNLAEELRLCRERAMSGDMPVALIFPSEGGTKAHSQSYYIVEGETPKITKVVDFSSEYPHTYIFNGFWDIDPSKLRDSSQTLTTAQPRTGTAGDTFDVEKWGPPAGKLDTKEYVLIFTPSGTMKTNSLPNFDGDFHILVNRAVAYEVAAIPPSAMDDPFMLCYLAPDQYFKLRKVSDPYTINISALGDISVTQGVTALLEGSVEIVPDGSTIPMSPPAVPQVMPASGNSNPAIKSVVIYPTPNPATLPAGADATVRKDAYVTLTLKAKDVDGDRLFCIWSSVKSGSGAPGGFSAPGEHRMNWSSAGSEWVNVTEWRPPSDAEVGNRYKLKCEVSDKRGGTATVEKVIEIINSEKIAFEGNAPICDRQQTEIFIMNSDGTAKRRITYGMGPGVIGSNNTRDAFLSPDGTKIVYYSESRHSPCVVNSDGTDNRTLSKFLNWEYTCWSHDGTMIYGNIPGIKIGFYATSDIASINSDGTCLRKLTDEPPIPTCDGHLKCNIWPRCSPDGRKVIFVHQYWDNPHHITDEIHIMNADGTERKLLSSIFLENEPYPTWAPDGKTILFATVSQRPRGIYAITEEGRHPVTGVLNEALNIYAAKTCWDDVAYLSVSPDGKKIVFIIGEPDSGSGGTGTHEIYQINTDGSEWKALNIQPRSNKECTTWSN